MGTDQAQSADQGKRGLWLPREDRAPPGSADSSEPECTVALPHPQSLAAQQNILRSSVLLRLQRVSGNQSVQALLAGHAETVTLAIQSDAEPPMQVHNRMQRQAGPSVVQRSWISDRTTEVVRAIQRDDYDGANAPYGAFFLLNGLSLEDMVRVVKSLSSGNRAKLEQHIEAASSFDKARIYSALHQAQAGSWWEERVQAVHHAIRSENFDSMSAPYGAFTILNGLNTSDLGKMLQFLDRDHLDALLANKDRASGFTSANTKMLPSIYHERDRRGATSREQNIQAAIVAGHFAAAFKALDSLSDADLTRALRGLPFDQFSKLALNIDAAEGIGVNPARLRYYLDRNDYRKENLTVDAFRGEVIYDVDYRHEGGHLSRWIQVAFHDNVESLVAVHLDRISDARMTPQEVEQQWSAATVGDGGRLWPASLNQSTTPRLWAAKQQAIAAMDTFNLEIIKLGAVAVLVVIDVALQASGLMRGIPSASWRRVPRSTRLPRSPKPKPPTLLPEISESTEADVARLIQDSNPAFRLTRANAIRALKGPPGAAPEVAGTGGAGSDVVFRSRVAQPASGNAPAAGGVQILRREVKCIAGSRGTGQGAFNREVAHAAKQVGYSGEILVQVPDGTDGLSMVMRFRGPRNPAELGRYRGVTITLVNPSGDVVWEGPLAP